MLDRLCLGVSFASISCTFYEDESTVRSIKKSEDKIRSSVASTSLGKKLNFMCPAALKELDFVN
uniref:Uncharacterized protein n=1 Tax=Glossina palpalis gambiensis TaxID=67801 RepID=A0A1B0BMQ5_9MUSC